MALAAGAVLALAWGAAAAVLLGRLADEQEARLAGAARAVRGQLAAAQAALLREARLLAEDAAVAAGVARGDWATLAGGASSRLRSLTLERHADLVLVLDGAGVPIAQVPPGARMALPEALRAAAGPAALPAVVDTRGWLFAVAPVGPVRDGRPSGHVVLARSLERAALDPAGAAVPLVWTAGDRLLAGTLAGAPRAGWAAATAAGRVAVQGRTWRLQPVAESAAGPIWMAAPPPLAAERERLVAALAGSLALALGACAVVAWASGTRTRAAPPVSPERGGRDVEAVYAAAAALGGTEDLGELAGRTLDVVRAVTGAEAGIVYRADHDAGVLVAVAQRGLTPERSAQLRTRPLASSRVGGAVREDRVTVVDLDESVLAGVAEAGAATAIALPIRVDGAAWGLLAVASRGRREPEPAEVRLLETIAHQVGLAVGRATLFEGMQETSRRLETLTRLAQRLTATLSAEEVVERVVDAAVEVFGSSVSRLWLMDEGGATLSLRASAGARAPVSGVTVLPVGEGLVGRVVASGEPLVSEDATTDPRVVNRQRIEAERSVAVAVVPVRRGERVLGALSIAVRDRHRYPPAELSLLQSLADQAAIALDNARLFGEERAGRAQLAALLDVNKTIGRVTSTEALLGSIAEEAARLLGLDNAGFRLVDGDDLVLAGLAGTAPETMVRTRIKRGESFSGRVVSEGRSLIAPAGSVADMIPEHRAAEQRLGYTSYLGVPVQVGDRIIGVLAFRGRRPFTARDQELAEAFAGQAAVALDHARLLRETTRQAERMRALAALGRLLTETLEQDVVGQRTADSVRALLGARSAGLYRLRPGTGDLEAVAVSGQVGQRFTPSVVFPAGTGVVGVAVRDRAAVVTPDLLDDPRFTFTEDLRERITDAGHRSVLAVPLLVQDRVIGALSVGDVAGRAFEVEEIALARAFADQAAVALENARLYAEAQERLRETTTLLEVGRVLSRPAPRPELMREVAREVARTFGADMVGAYFLDPERRALVPLAGYHVPPDLREFFTTRPIVIDRVPWLQEAWMGGHAVWSADTHADRRFDADWVGSLPPHSVLFAPTTARGTPIGGLFLVWWHTGRAFPPAEQRLLEGVAAQVGLAMENVELARETEAKLRETETLLSVSRALSTTLDLETLLRHFLRSVAAATGADCVGYWSRAGDDWLDGRVGYHVPPAYLDRIARVRLSLHGDGFFAEAARSRRPVFTADAMADPRFPRTFTEAAPHRAHLFVPLVTGDRLIGGFAAIWLDRVRDFSPGDVAFMEAIGSQAAVAIEHARLFEENRAQVEELSALHGLSRAVTGQLDGAALLDAIHAHLARILDVRNLAILLTEEETGDLTVALRVVDGARDTRPPLRYPRAAAGLTSVVLASGRSLRTDDYVGECARHGVAPDPLAGDRPYWVGVPMQVSDRVLGVLILRGRERGFTERDERLLGNIAHLAALALASARLYAERTRAYRELAAAQDQLVRTEKLRALGEMASGVAHDFNNLLASILGRAQLLLRRVQEPQLRQWLEVIERSALDGAQTVRRLQEFTRVRRDQPMVSVDLNQIVHDALEITQSRWREEPSSRGITIDVRTVFGGRTTVAGDPAELREAMTNLILNAVDAMPAGGTLTIVTARAGDRVELSVADTGVGMPPGVKEKIFDPFFTTKGPQGTGLGLSMSYGILSRHGATIGVESVEGLGTTFRIAFAAAEPAWPAAPPAPDPAAAVPALRCLVVDDEEPVARVLADVLETLGHAAVVLLDGADAIARFRAERFDAVFTDLAMPHVSGWQVARAVKAIAPAVPVVLVTGFGVELSAEERRGRGVDAVLAKPLQIQEVRDAVGELFRARGGAPRTEGEQWPTTT